MTPFSARPRSFRTAPVWFVGVGLAIIVAGSFIDGWARFLGWFLGAAYASIGIVVRLRKLVVQDQHLTVITGPLHKSVDLSRLTRVAYIRKGGGRSAYIRLHLSDASGRGLVLPVGGLLGFTRDDEWATLILKEADRTGATVDDRARLTLTKADGSGAGYIA